MIKRTGTQTRRVVAPGDLLHELESRLAEPAPTLKGGHSRRRRFGLTGALAVAGLLAFGRVSAAFALVTDSGNFTIEVQNKTQYASGTTNAGATAEYIGDSNITFGSSGSGVFDSFVRVQNTPTEQGYNTDGTLQFDTSAGNFTHSILVSNIPVVTIGGVNYWELFADINDGNGGANSKISLNDLEVYFTADHNLTGYPFTSTATKEYDFAGSILINDVNQGSGRGDLRYRIPVAGIPIAADAPHCGYRDPLCTTYFVLYSRWGTTSAAYASDGGFEEWKVKQYPTLQIVKHTVGGDGTFNFIVSGTPTPPPVTNPSITTVAGTGSTQTYIVNPGTYTIGETVPAGWTLTGATCSLNGGTSTAYTQGANIVLGATDHVVCTFTNTKQGALTLVKNTVGGDGTFNFTHTIAGLSEIAGSGHAERF